MLNKSTIIGNVGNKGDLKHLKNDSQVINLSVATKQTWRGNDGAKNESTQWHSVACWGKLAEVVNQYVEVGDQIAVVGTLKYDKWEDESGNSRKKAKIRADEVKFLGQSQGGGDDFDDHNPDPEPHDQSFDDDDIPF